MRNYLILDLPKMLLVKANTHVSTRVMGTYGYAAPEYAMTGECPSLVLSFWNIQCFVDLFLYWTFVKDQRWVMLLKRSNRFRILKTWRALLTTSRQCKPSVWKTGRVGNHNLFRTLSGPHGSQGGNGFGSRKGQPQPVVRTLSSPHQIPSPKPTRSNYIAVPCVDNKQKA